MTTRHHILAGRFGLVGLTLLIAATVPAMMPPAGPAPSPATATVAPRPFAGAADLLAAERALRRSLDRGFVRHVEFDPDERPGLAIEFELVTDGLARLIELRRLDERGWTITDSAPRVSSVRSRRYFDRLSGSLEDESHLSPAEAASRAESVFPGAIAVEVDLLLRGEEPIYEVTLVRGTEALELELPARVAAAAASPPACSYACLVEAVVASTRHGEPFAFESRADGDRLVHEVLVLDPRDRVVRVRHAAGSVAFLGLEPAVRPAPAVRPPGGALARALESLERVLAAAGTSPAAMTGGDLFPVHVENAGDPGGPWLLRAWTPSGGGMLLADVHPERGEVVLRIRPRSAPGPADPEG